MPAEMIDISARDSGENSLKFHGKLYHLQGSSLGVERLVQNDRCKE